MIDRQRILTDEQLGARLLMMRKHRKLTQEALADLAGVAHDTVRRLEKGAFSPSFDTMVKVACGLGVPVPALFCDDYGVADDLATVVRGLPEREQLILIAVVGVLRVQLAVESGRG
jgi:transcriptional regulator with XRE-family HTH domain